MSDLSDFRRMVYEPETKALRTRLRAAEADRDRAREALRPFVGAGGRLVSIGGEGNMWEVRVLREQRDAARAALKDETP